MYLFLSKRSKNIRQSTLLTSDTLHGELNEKLQLFNALEPSHSYCFQNRLSGYKPHTINISTYYTLSNISEKYSVCFQIETTRVLKFAGIIKVLYSRWKFSFWLIIHRFPRTFVTTTSFQRETFNNNNMPWKRKIISH